jgi:hypothetical protein
LETDLDGKNAAQKGDPWIVARMARGEWLAHDERSYWKSPGKADGLSDVLQPISEVAGDVATDFGTEIQNGGSPSGFVIARSGTPGGGLTIWTSREFEIGLGRRKILVKVRYAYPLLVRSEGKSISDLLREILSETFL